MGGVGANQVERLADHFLRLVAEDRRRAGIPDRDQMVLVGADQAVAERHRDALEAALGDPAQHVAEIDFVERNGAEIDDDGDVEQRGIEHERPFRLQQDRPGLDGERPFRPSRPTRRPADSRRHDTIMTSARMPSPTSVTISDVHCSARFCRINSAASVCSVGPDTISPFGTLKRSPSSSAVPPMMTFLSFSRLQRRLVAAQHVDVGNLRDRVAADAEIDQERRALLVILSGQHRAHRGQEFAIEFLAERIAADQAVRLDLDIDDRRPGMAAELRQRPIDVDRGLVDAGLLEGRQDHRSAGAFERRGKVLVRRSVGWRAEIDIEGDVLHFGLLQPAQQVGVKLARPRPDADLVDRGASIATITISPLACRDCQPNRRSASAWRSAPCQPHDRTIASAIITRICGRNCFTLSPSPRSPSRCSRSGCAREFANGARCHCRCHYHYRCCRSRGCRYCRFRCCCYCRCHSRYCHCRSRRFHCHSRCRWQSRSRPLPWSSTPETEVAAALAAVLPLLAVALPAAALTVAGRDRRRGRAGAGRTPDRVLVRSASRCARGR